MNALTFLWRLYLLIVAAWWITLLVVASAIAWAIYEGWRWARPRYLAWRNERQLSTEIQARRGWRDIKRRGLVPKDLQ
jgi:hypothetical protein